MSKAQKQQSVDELVHKLWKKHQDYPYETDDYRNAIIDALHAHSGIDSVRDSVVNFYQSSIHPFYGMDEQQQSEAFHDSLTDEEKAVFDAAQYDSAIDNLPYEEQINYYDEQYRKQTQSLTDA